MGSHHGIEKKLAQRAGLSYRGISTGKWRRYFDLKNFVDLFRVPLGLVEAWWMLGAIRPKVVFSKGGFVALPVVWAAWLRRIPVVIHESDALPGLTTRLSAPFARKVLLAYETTHMELSRWEKKIEMVGNPVRLTLFDGNKKSAQKKTGFDGKRPVLLVMGGSSGARQLNQLVEQEKEALIRHFDVILISGNEGKDRQEQHFVEWPYVDQGMNDVYALASLALTRAGANTLAELHALQIPALLYPLGSAASRGDQLANAQVMALESSLFQIADESKPALEQVLNLPLRSDQTRPNTTTEKIAFSLLSYA